MICYTDKTKIIGKMEALDEATISKINTIDNNNWNNWTMINNELYYYKLFNFNELIGEYLCKYLGLDSVHNELSIESRTLYLVTKSFIENNCKYRFSKFESFESFLKNSINEGNKNKLIIDHMKLFAIDIYMRQIDRKHYSNMTYKINKNGYISLAPVYDFSNAFGIFNYYTNVYFDIAFDKYEFNNLFKEYPHLFYKLEKLYKLDFYNIISSILLDYRLEMTDEKWMYYEKQSEKSNKILKKILY